MARISESGKEIMKVPSQFVDNENYQHLGGYILQNNNIKYFYRQNQRYTEVTSGIFGDKYGFGMDLLALDYCHKNYVEYIVIETQYNVWEISTSEFIENGKQHPAISGLVLCSEEYFMCYEKEDDLDEPDEEKEPEYSEDAPLKLMDKADNIEQLKEVLENEDGYFHEDDIPKGKRSASNCIEYAVRAFKVNKKAEINGKKAKEEEPIGKREPDKKKDKEYSEGEQINMF